MKFQIIIAIMILISSIPLVSGLDYQIDGDKVFIDDDNAYLSVEPATLGSSGWITIEVESKKVSTNFDFGFGFDKDLMKPKQIQLWTNYSHPKEIITYDIKQIYDNITGWQNITVTNITYQNIFYEDWKTISLSYTKYTFNYQGFDTWYVSPSVFLTKNIRYKIRIWCDINFTGIKENTGKYFIGIKPTIETLQQAISNNHFYYIDPWWDSTWTKRVIIFIDDAYIQDQLKNFPVFVWINTTISAQMQSDGDDIRFVAQDNSTLYNFEIENISATDGILCWVNVTCINMSGDGDTIMWLYYGNAGATNGQNPTGVWDQYYTAGAVFHLNSTDAWDSTSNHYAKIATDSDPSLIPGPYGNSTNFDGNDGYRFDDILDIGTNVFTIEAWIATTTVDATNRRICSKYDATGYSFNVGTGGNRNLYMELWDGTNDLLPNTGVTSNTNLKNGSWHYAWCKTYGSTKVGNVSFDKLFYGGQTLAAMGSLATAYQFAIGTQHASSNYFTGSIDELRISIGISRNESWLNATFDNRNTSAFLIWGINETYVVVGYCTIESGYMFNGTTSVCPCNVNLGLNVTNSHGYSMDVSFYFFDSNTTNAWIKFGTIGNVTNGTYYICLCNISLAYNKTFFWYGNVTNQTIFGNNTGVYYFTTVNEPANCSSSGYSIVSHGDDNMIGLLGILGLIGFLIWRKRRK